VRNKSKPYQSWIANKLSCQPEERLLKIIIRLGRDVVVLKVLLAVEGNGLRLHLALLDIDLVAGEDNWDVFADTDQITWSGNVSVANIQSSG